YLIFILRPPTSTLFPYTTLFRSYTRPILTEVEGEVIFEDLVDGASVSEQTDETTGFTKRLVIDWRSSQRGEGLKPAVAVGSKGRSEEHTSELQSRENLVCRLLLE